MHGLSVGNSCFGSRSLGSSNTWEGKVRGDNEGGLAWAACGKPLVSKWKALRSRGCSLKKYAGNTTPRFPTGYHGPWKTRISVPGLQDHKMAGQADGQETTPAGFPQPLFRCEGSRRLLRYEEVPPLSWQKCARQRAFVQKLHVTMVFGWVAMMLPRTPRGDF